MSLRERALSRHVINLRFSGELQGLIIGPLQDPVTLYGINSAGTQITQWDFQNEGTLTSPARLFFLLEVSLRCLRPSRIYSVPWERIVQKRAYLIDI